MYFLTELAVQLNEPEAEVAPTDTRNRPDLRFMENGRWAEANQEQIRLKDKQQAAYGIIPPTPPTFPRRISSAKDFIFYTTYLLSGRKYPSYKPLWFRKRADPITGKFDFQFEGKYWDCKQKKNWSMCPNIY